MAATELERAAGACRSTRSARRRPRRRARPGSTSRASATAASTRCSARSSPTLRLLHLCGEHRRAVAMPRQQIDAIAVYRVKRDRQPPMICAGRRTPSSLSIRRAPARAARRAGRPAIDAHDRHRRDQRGGGRGRRRRLGSASKPPTSPTTTRCWPLPRGCATSPADMNATDSRTGMSWSARLLIGAAADPRRRRRAPTWGLAHYRAGGALPRRRPAAAAGRSPTPQPVPLPPPSAQAAGRRRQQRARGSPSSKRGWRGSRMRRSGRRARPGAPTRWWSPSPRAGRSIAASRSAISRPCWSTASARSIQRAVATIITASRQPVRLDDLIADYETLGPELRRGGPQDSWWTELPARTGLAGRQSTAPTRRRPSPTRAIDRRRAAAGSRRRRPGAGRDHAAARRRRAPRLGRQGAALRRRAPRARRDRIRRAARRGAER